MAKVFHDGYSASAFACFCSTTDLVYNSPHSPHKSIVFQSGVRACTLNSDGWNIEFGGKKRKGHSKINYTEYRFQSQSAGNWTTAIRIRLCGWILLSTSKRAAWSALRPLGMVSPSGYCKSPIHRTTVTRTRTFLTHFAIGGRFCN